jgi:hypothetical protein
MLRRNINVDTGLVNGATGQIVGFRYLDDSTKKVIKSLVVKFDAIEQEQCIERVTAEFELTKVLKILQNTRK